MKTTVWTLIVILFSQFCYAQKPADDTWSNVPKAQDDRFTNPKSAIYAGPNGWWNFGEIRAEGTTDASLKYAFKGGLTTNGNIFILVESGKLQVFHLDFGTDNPAPGVYQVSKEPNTSQKKVVVSFGDVSGKKILNWSGSEGAVTVTKVGAFIYFKCRNIVLQPTGISHEGNTKQALKAGFEGAAKP